MTNIPCQHCGKLFPSTWNWFICDDCHYRICQPCISKHSGKSGNSGFRCSQCAFGIMRGPKKIDS